jgi:hypothetical protein
MLRELRLCHFVEKLFSLFASVEMAKATDEFRLRLRTREFIAVCRLLRLHAAEAAGTDFATRSLGQDKQIQE